MSINKLNITIMGLAILLLMSLTYTGNKYAEEFES